MIEFGVNSSGCSSYCLLAYKFWGVLSPAHIVLRSTFWSDRDCEKQFVIVSKSCSKMRFEILLYLLILWPAAWEWRSQQWLQLVCSLHSLQVCSKSSVMPREWGVTWYKALAKDFLFHFFSGHHGKRRWGVSKMVCPPSLVRKFFAWQ